MFYRIPAVLPAQFCEDPQVFFRHPVGICEIRHFLLQLCKEKQTTILLSGHNLSEIEQLADIIDLRLHA